MRRFSRSSRQAEDEPSRHEGYYPIADSPAAGWSEEDDWDAEADWDDRPGGVNRDPFANEVDQESRGLGRTGWRRLLTWKWIRRGLLLLAAVVILLIGYLAITAPLSKSLQPVVPPQVTLLASDGTPIARSGAITEPPVPVSELPPHVVDAFLSVEDRRFYSHWGVDPRGLARAAWSNATDGTVQGGSTITQQLAKFTFLTPERSLTRKAREMLIAFWLESWLTKDEILTRYLANAYFGDNTYGLHAASLHYFHRRPQNLTVAQAAMLAGLVQAPSYLAPSKHYQRAEERMLVVLGTMVAAGHLTQAEADAVKAPSLDIRSGDVMPTGTYFADWALPQARDRVESGYARQTLTTTLDARLQTIARDAVARAPLGGAQAALVAMRRNGEVVAMVGGKDYASSPFNRATQARRQAGSTFKLFVYLAALEAGAQPDDVVSNLPIETGSYRPKNSGGKYSESLTLEQAFAASSNVATVRLFEQVGSENVIEMARAFGIEAPMDQGDPSLALGTASIPLIDLTAAYAGVASNSFPVEPTAFPKPEQGWWDWFWNGPESLGSADHEAIETMLRSAINSGTGRAAMLAGPNYGKTGTTQDNRDALFVGYAGDLVVGVWIGNDDNSSLGDISGGGAPARIWKDFMRRALGAQDQATNGGSAPRADPSGPVEPLDVPEPSDIPSDLPGDLPGGPGDVSLRMEDGEVILRTRVEGIPIDVRLGEGGMRMDDEAIEEARREAEERVREEIAEATERARETAGER
ncbi:transglycosylase domain-containing protein [Erythrobacteraceae bacterium WH01K]|nr:transglycosylase domain-containing protein [Erythrobacteraceae bacterium WH01K]